MKYVVCLDTMGQDREITESQKRFALETVERYIKIWEQEERVALAADRDRRLEMLQEGDGEPGAADATLSADIANDVEDFEFQEGNPDAIYFQKVFEKEEVEGEATPIEAKDAPKDKKEAPKKAPEPVPVTPPENLDDELREIEIKFKTLKVIASKFLKEEVWKDMLKNLLQYRVMRYPQIIQSLMFLTGSKREEICLPNTN